MKNLFILNAFLFIQATFFAQGTVRGKITDESGESVVGCKIWVSEEKRGAVTDLDGNYTITLKTNEKRILIFTLIGYDTIVETFQLSSNQVVIKDFTFHPYTPQKIGEIKEVTITGKQVKANDPYMEKLKINSATTIDYISSETMKKTGDANVTAAVSRVSGVSTNGGMITVRGIGDRYIKTTLNGSRIPTLDPLTNNIKLDIFPASLVDNIVITKTASPELPGDWSGAYLSVETKDYPDKLTVNVESQFGYNAQTTFKDFISSDKSSTDWLGFDNGLRNRNDNPIKSPYLTPTTYQELVALGLGNYYSKLGVNGWVEGSQEGDTYFRLGLVELGLLPKALINDQNAYLQARNQYNADYKNQAFSILNPNGTDYSNGFANNWNPKFNKAPLNFTQNFSIGDQKTLFGKPFGYFYGFRYGNTVRYDPNGISQRVGDEALNYQFENFGQNNARISRETNSWSMLLNLACKLNENNKVSLLVMPNFSGTNDVAEYNTMHLNTVTEELRTQKTIFYEQRKQMIYQFSSQHLLPKKKIKIDYNASYTKGNSIAPDFKVTQYNYVVQDDSVLNYEFSPNAGDGIRRYYRYLTESLFDSRASVEIPIIKSSEKLVRKLKTGISYQRNNRKSDLEEYYLYQGNNAFSQPLMNNDINAYLSSDKFTMNNGTIDFYYLSRDFARNHTFGYSDIKAAFGMLDYDLTSSFRFAGGIRVEHAEIYTDVDLYDRFGFKRNDPRRANLAGFPLVNPGELNETNVLPSGSLIYKIKSEKIKQSNLRLNYSQTVARPSIRELNDAAVYDNEYRTLIYGNSDLKTVHIKNFDFRGEAYFNNGDNISASLFYKDFTNHIEMGFGSSGITWDNIKNSTAKGIEIEGKKTIGKHIELRTNVTLVKSNSQYIRKDLTIVDGEKVYTPIDTVNRTMYGQAPYIINSIVTFKSDTLGLVFTASYNIQGPRLVITGVVKGRPDVYEIPRNTIDAKISKKLGKYFSVNLTIRDILNAPVRRAYKLPSGWVDYDNFRYGTNYVLGVSYKL